MIVIWKRKLVYTAIPKCGTHSIMNILTKYGAQQLQLTTRWGSSGYHDYTTIFNPGWTTVSTVRHPLTRIPSIWKHAFSDMVFEDFLNKLLNDDIEEFWARSQTAWINHLNGKINYKIMRLENINEDINSILRPLLNAPLLKVARLNSSAKYINPFTKIDAKYIDLIYNKYMCDFQNFNYMPSLL